MTKATGPKGHPMDRAMKKGVEATRKAAPKGSIPVLECPDCGRSDLSYVAGMETGHQYQCPHCGYQGAFVIERDRTGADLRRDAGLEEE